MFMDYYKQVVESSRSSVRQQIAGDDTVANELKVGVRDVPYDQSQPQGIMYGYNLSRDKTKSFPRLSHAHMDAMMAGTDTVHFTELCAILSNLFEPGSDQWFEYLAIRVAQRKQQADGLGEYTVVRNVFPPYLPKSLKDKPEGTKVKKYELIQFFTDSYIIDKYELSTKFINSIQALAISDPPSAAATLQDKVQQLSPGVVIKVSPGRYSHGRAQCIKQLATAARGLVDSQGATDSIIVSDQMFIYQPGEVQGKRWSVFGPLDYATTVRDVYKLVLKAGMRQVGVLFGIELVKLKIFLDTGAGLVSTSFTGNAGDSSLLNFQQLRYSMLIGSAMEEAKQKVVNCVPVVSDGKSVATGLRVSDSMVIVNAHVVEGIECSIGDQQLVGGVPIGSDLWAYHSDGQCSPWKIRVPHTGERAVMMASVGSKVMVSSDFIIDKVDGVNIFSHRIPEVAEGASGAALISLEDGALLGMHSGLTNRYMLAIVIGPNIMMDIRECESDMARGQMLRDDVSLTVMSELDKRGARASFMTVVENLLPVFDMSGVHVGSAMNTDCKLLTTLPPGDYLLGYNKTHTVFESFTGLYSVCYDSIHISDKNPAITRTPDTFESVVIVGVDASSSYVSRPTVIRQVAPGKRTFMLASTEGNIYPLSGGVIVSMQDAAVLGVYVKDSTSMDVGRLSLCVTVVRQDSATVRDDVSFLAERFPSLGIRAWPPGAVDEILTHSSVQGQRNNLGLARIGDSQARTALLIALREAQFDGNAQDEFVKYQSNEAFADMAWKVGLAPLLRKQSGLSFTASAKAYADLMEAFLGAVSLYETKKTFNDICISFDAIPSMQDRTPKELRRGSSFSGLNVPFGAELAGTDTLLTPVD